MKSFYWKLLLSHIGLQGRGGCLHTSLHLIFLITRGFLRAWEQPIKKKNVCPITNELAYNPESER